jgi:hypothetical protein
MNNGIFPFTTLVGNNIIDFTQFDVSGYYNVPKGATWLAILTVGGGGGGGGGRMSAAGTAASGGGGGGGGGKVFDIIPCEYMGFNQNTSFRITLGAGGNGGAGAAGQNLNGSNGSAGGATTISVWSVTNYIWVIAPGGNGGTGGSSTNGSGGFAGSNLMPYGASSAMPVNVGQGGIGSTGAGNPVTLQTWGYNGGAGGGGVSTTQVASQGGNIQFASVPSALAPISFRYQGGNPSTAGALIGGIANGGTVDGAGASATSAIDGIMGWIGNRGPGYGGAGGGGGATAAGGPGGNGFRGGGGGGGGGVLTGQTSAPGGNGGNGYVAIWAW